MELSSYFEPQLVQFIDTITKSTNSSRDKSSMLYEDLRRSHVCMIIALLCFTMNPQCCFIQTIVGLMCYAYGLRDKEFDLLNTMGCTCSIDHIRTHGSYWTSRHKPILQLNAKKFWRVTIDNLNFYLKFAKSLPESSSGAKKMLNLLTGQVTHQVSTEITKQKGPLRLLELVHNFIERRVHSTVSTRAKSDVKVEHFKLIPGTNENYYYDIFWHVCYTCSNTIIAFSNCTW